MNILRQGPKHLIIQSENCDVTFNKLKDTFTYQISLFRSPDMYDEYINMIGLMDDSSTVLMFSMKMEPKLSFEYEDFEYIAVVNSDCEDILIKLVQIKEEVKIQNLRSTPQLIVMRTTGDSQKYINTVNYDIKGEMISREKMFEGYGRGTIIIFTDKKIRGPLGYEDFHSQAIYSDKKYYQLAKYLDNHRVKYVNASIDNKDWSELVIKIYDSYERYDLHYDRLSMVLNELDCGLILGESWGKDAALAFLSVGVYQVRLFTYLNPLDIKKITIGLEYNNDGDRIVDYDLFTKRKKHDWTQVRTGNIKKRDNLGVYYREKLESDLTEGTLAKLLSLENQIK